MHHLHIEWFMEFKCIEVKCPCCYMHTNKPAELKPAPQLLKVIMVHCITFTNGVKKLKITAHMSAVLHPQSMIFLVNHP